MAAQSIRPNWKAATGTSAIGRQRDAPECRCPRAYCTGVILAPAMYPTAQAITPRRTVTMSPVMDAASPTELSRERIRKAVPAIATEDPNHQNRIRPPAIDDGGQETRGERNQRDDQSGVSRRGHADTNAEQHGPYREARNSRNCKKTAVPETRRKGKPKRECTDQRNGAGENRAQYPRCQRIDVHDGDLGRHGCCTPYEERQKRKDVDG